MGSLQLSSCAVLLALHAASLSVAATDPPPTAICGLAGFQLGVLQSVQTWNVTLEDKTNCIIPNGKAVTDIKSCTVYFSICKALPRDVCNNFTNSSTCEEVILNDGSQFYYDIGDYRGNNEFKALVSNTSNTVGFTAIRQGSQVINGRRCKSIYDTILEWTCDDNRVWSAESRDVSRFVLLANRFSDCTLSVTMGYSGACYEAPTLAPDTCQLPPYNVIGLDSTPPRQVSVKDHNLCHNLLATECTIYMSFCGALPFQSELGVNCYSASLCLVVGTATGVGASSYSMGQFNTAKFKDNPNGGVGGGFQFEVVDGTRPEDGKCNHINGIRTTVVLLCNQAAVWKDSDISEFAHVETTDPLKNCEYLITVQYDGACEAVGPQSPQSFVGWILIAIFCFAVIVYLFVGAGFQYFVKGARGVEVIPNYAFWMVFLSLVLEGFKFSFNTITCYKFEGTIKIPFSGPGKSSVDYDKI